MVKTVFKHVVVSTRIYDELKNLGNTGDSFNDVILMLIKGWKNKLCIKENFPNE